MGIYRRLYPQVEEAALQPLRQGERFSIHGSEVRDLFLRHLAGKCAVDNQAEKLLQELVDEGVLAHDPYPEPTLSQSAFFGLGARKHPGWVPGTIEHFRYHLGQLPI